MYGNRKKSLAIYTINRSGSVIINHSLQSNIRNLLSNKSSCDVKLRVRDEIEEAHKSILVARSPVFHEMFQQEMLEIVDIHDVDIATLKLLLNFFYSDTVEKMDYNCVKKLVIAAHCYGVPHLKEICASSLESDMSEKNACEIALLAERVHHADLKSFALHFIAYHHTDIFIQPDWLSWSKYNMELAAEVFQKLTEQQKN
ncbi:speckle-type POZ protein-like [Parasteatoda tepidariorum]|uniref:speckle-type POZ protein-like n=1 Tax=Parasteatoda tepidariorum TaxID=114398 RepID=UPI001C719CC9|nr:speckle-type POZ protein-like [Parasteatoda tepidariorum]